MYWRMTRSSLGSRCSKRWEFEFLDDKRAKGGGISLKSEFKQSNMMKSTMCRTQGVNSGTGSVFNSGFHSGIHSGSNNQEEASKGLRIRTLKDKR